MRNIFFAGHATEDPAQPIAWKCSKREGAIRTQGVPACNPEAKGFHRADGGKSASLKGAYEKGNPLHCSKLPCCWRLSELNTD